MSVSEGNRPAAPAADLDPAEFVLELPSDLRLIEAAIAYMERRCRALYFDGVRLRLNLRVGLAEALANAMIYGNGGDPRKRVRVEARLSTECVAFEVRDQGEGFDPDSVADPTLPGNLERPGGRGIFLLRELMDEVRFNDRGNAVCLVLYREPPPLTAAAN